MGLVAKTVSGTPAPSPDTRLVYRESNATESVQEALLRLVADENLPDILDVGDAIGSRSSDRFPPFNNDRTVVVGDLDALVGMSTFRVGFLVAPETLVLKIRTWKQAFSICTAAPSQRAALTAIDAGNKEVS
jgi:aspartate/methionine/tyrosine aminotransferase